MLKLERSSRRPEVIFTACCMRDISLRQEVCRRWYLLVDANSDGIEGKVLESSFWSMSSSSLPNASPIAGRTFGQPTHLARKAVLSTVRRYICTQVLSTCLHRWCILWNQLSAHISPMLYQSYPSQNGGKGTDLSSWFFD